MNYRCRDCPTLFHYYILLSVAYTFAKVWCIKLKFPTLNISLRLTLFVLVSFCFAGFIKNGASVSKSKVRRKYVIMSMVSQIPSTFIWEDVLPPCMEAKSKGLAKGVNQTLEICFSTHLGNYSQIWTMSKHYCLCSLYVLGRDLLNSDI